MKKIMSIAPFVGVCMFVAGLALATGVGANPIQGLYAIAALAGAAFCFGVAQDNEEEEEKPNTKKYRKQPVYDYRTGKAA